MVRARISALFYVRVVFVGTTWIVGRPCSVLRLVLGYLVDVPIGLGVGLESRACYSYWGSAVTPELDWGSAVFQALDWGSAL